MSRIAYAFCQFFQLADIFKGRISKRVLAFTQSKEIKINKMSELMIMSSKTQK